MAENNKPTEECSFCAWFEEKYPTMFQRLHELAVEDSIHASFATDEKPVEIDGKKHRIRTYTAEDLRISIPEESVEVRRGGEE